MIENRILKSLFKSKALIALFLCMFLSGCGGWGKIQDLSTAELYEQQKECWTCQMFINVFRAFGGVQDKSGGVYGKGETGLIEGVFTETYKSAQNLLLICFALWLLFVTGKLLVSPSELPQYLSKLLKKTLFVIVGVIILSKPEGIHTITTYVIYPIFTMFIELAVQIVDSGAGIFGEGGNVTCTVTDLTTGKTTGTTLLGTWEFTGKFNDFFQPLKCFLELIHKRSGVGQVQAWRMIDNNEFGFGNLLIGYTMLGMFFFMDIILALSIVDSIFTIGVVMVLIPLLIVAWIFEISRGYVKPAFAAFLGACSQCAVVSIFVSYTTATFKQFMDNTDKKSVITSIGELEYDLYPVLEQGVALQEDGPVWSIMFMMLVTFLGMSKMSGMLGNIIGSKTNMFASVFKQTVAVSFAVGTALVFGVAKGGKYLATKGAKTAAEQTQQIAKAGEEQSVT